MCRDTSVYSASLSETLAFWQTTFTRAQHRQRERFVIVWLWTFKLECRLRWWQACCCCCCTLRGSRLWQAASFLGAQQLLFLPAWRGGLTCCGDSSSCRKRLNVSCCSQKKEKKKKLFRVTVRKLGMDVTLWHVTPRFLKGIVLSWFLAAYRRIAVLTCLGANVSICLSKGKQLLYSCYFYQYISISCICRLRGRVKNIIITL